MLQTWFLPTRPSVCERSALRSGTVRDAPGLISMPAGGCKGLHQCPDPAAPAWSSVCRFEGVSHSGQISVNLNPVF